MRVAVTRREPFDLPDGINTFVLSLSDALLARGHRVTLVSGPFTDPERMAGFFRCARYPEVVSLGCRPGCGTLGSLALWAERGKRVLDRIAPDVVLVNGALPVAFRQPTWIVSHDLERRYPSLGPTRVTYKRLAYRNADRIIATCSELRGALSRELRIDAGRIGRIPTCVNGRLYRQPAPGARQRAILHLGTAKYKNAEATIRAFSLMRAADAKLYVTGRRDQVSRELLDGLPRSVSERVEFPGYVPADELRELLGRVMAVSVPSEYVVPVASPSVIESFAAGTPVVGSESISRDILWHGRNGYRCDCRDDARRAGFCDALLAGGPDWATLSRGSADAAGSFSAERVAQAYLEEFASRA